MSGMRLMKCEECGRKFFAMGKRKYCPDCTEELKERERANRWVNIGIMKARKYTNRATWRNDMGAEIYTLRSTPHQNAWQITKFDNDLNVLTSYLVTNGECNCPRGEQGKQCRHQDMLRTFARAKHIDDGWFFNYNTKQWLPAISTGEDPSAPSLPEDPPLEEVGLASPPVGGSASGIIRRRV